MGEHRSPNRHQPTGHQRRAGQRIGPPQQEDRARVVGFGHTTAGFAQSMTRTRAECHRGTGDRRPVTRREPATRMLPSTVAGRRRRCGRPEPGAGREGRRGAWTAWTAGGPGKRPRQIEHAPRLALQQRQHVRPVETHQHQAGTAIPVHDVDQPRGAIVSLRRGLVARGDVVIGHAHEDIDDLLAGEFLRGQGLDNANPRGAARSCPARDGRARTDVVFTVSSHTNGSAAPMLAADDATQAKQAHPECRPAHDSRYRPRPYNPREDVRVANTMVLLR
jgi:hypothetical protein